MSLLITFFLFSSLTTAFGQDEKPKKPQSVSDQDIQTEEKLYSNGNRMLVREFYRDKEDKVILHGYEWFYYSTGVLQEKAFYQHGKREKTSEFFYPSGKPSHSKHFVNDLQVGSEIWFDEETGKKYRELQFDKDVASGEWKWFYEDGSPVLIEQWKDNTRDGKWKWFYENGKLGIEGDYFDNQQAGVWKYFNSDGSLLREATFTSREELVAKKKAEEEAYQKELEEFKAEEEARKKKEQEQ